MVFLVADESTLLKELGLFIEPVEVYDPNGKLLGLFVPGNLERCKEQYARAAAKIDRAELARRMQSKEPGYTFEEVKGRLRALEAEVARRKAAGEKELTPEEALAFIQALRDSSQKTSAAPDGVGILKEQGTCPTP